MIDSPAWPFGAIGAPRAIGDVLSAGSSGKAADSPSRTSRGKPDRRGKTDAVNSKDSGFGENIWLANQESNLRPDQEGNLIVMATLPT